MYFFLLTRNENRLTRERISPLRINKIRNTPAGLDCPIALLEEFVAVEDVNVCTSPIMTDKDILEFFQSTKNIIDADFNDENEMNNAAPVPTSSDIRNSIKSALSYLDTHFNGEMNKMDAIDAKKGTMQRKISDNYPKTQ
ncbi:hypothetical protein TNCV_4909361 [Trichonephila clavipes]|uniref:Uncharacterized protein n=1 Tax=Trichonephila clavipes TaxID=2585209 RepID=A0A8X6V3V3_TRICX|nr:hypothetical protein TNCV_4909361 [Trichonephila clavipes]